MISFSRPSPTTRKRTTIRRNRLDNDALADLQGFVERIPGVTTLVKDPVTGDLRARSGNQVRLVILLEDQSPPDPDAPPSPTADLTEDQAGMAADGFLASAAGVTSQGRLQGPDGPSGGTTRTMAMPQKPGDAEAGRVEKGGTGAAGR
ncbi:C3H1-type domain-containing protein [Durusdinium trenchii]|uniref:C3H1-type domain-containing protein n=1 Tax=Durusdinium trenchii TaxID=1381693 RepID=A0ABP0N7Q1_9DINO